MYEDHEFHDSYYHHTCLIIPEKDVLETDIVGTGCATRIIRWWNDLFLLSYSSERSRGFYTSSHAMRIERFRQYRKYRQRIHPMSKFRNFWECLILHVFIVNKIIFRFTTSFIFDDLPIHLFYTGALLEIIIIADLYVNLKTGYIDVEAKRVILDTVKSLNNYCCKKLFIHFASAMPRHWLLFLKYGSNITCGMCKTNRFTCALKILGVFSVFRVIETSTYWTHKRSSANKIHLFSFLRIAAIGLVTMVQFFDLSEVLNLLVFFHNGHVPNKSLLGVRAALKYGTTPHKLSNYMVMCYDVSRIFKALFLFNYGIREKHYYLDKLTALLSCGLANLFYAWSLFECYAIVSRVVFPKDRIIYIKDGALNLLRSRQLSDKLENKIKEYFNFKPSKLQIVERKNELYRSLPDALKREAILSCHMKIMMRIPFFTDLPLPVLENIVLTMRKEVYSVNDIIAEANVQAEGLMVIDKGVLAVYSQYHKEQGHLIDGDYFGELSLVTDKEVCMSFVVAITVCTILILDKKLFRNLMKDRPKLFAALKQRIKRGDHKNSVVTSSLINNNMS